MQVREVFLFGNRAADEDAVGIVERRRRKHRVGRLTLGVALLGSLVDLLGGVQGGWVSIEWDYGYERGARVLGIEVDLAVLQRLVRYLLGAQIELCHPVEPVGGECLGVHTAKYELLGEVLGSDDYRRAAPAAGARAVGAANVAAGDDQQQREARKQRGYRADQLGPVLHLSSFST